MVHSITLQTYDGTVTDNDILGQICFAAPNEEAFAAGAVTASIFARSETSFDDDDNNETELVFATASGGATGARPASDLTGDMTLSSAGLLTLAGNLVIPDGGNIGTTDTDAIAIAGNGVVTMNQIPVFSAGINVSGGTIAGTIATATQNSITTMTGLVTVGTIGTGVWQGTDVAVAHGGTGASSLTDGGILLGSGTGAITAMSVLGDGVIVVGDNSTDPTTITAFTASDGVLKHEVGGLELNISAIAIGDVLAGTGTGAVGIVTSTGHSDGDVLTLQADGTADWESAGGGSARSVAGDTNNGIVTWVTSDNTFAVESNLSYTGGDLLVGGSTPSVTIGDAGTEDTKLVFDGNAQDFYIGLDDTDDDLKIGLGSAVGTTPVITMAGTGAVSVGVDDTGYDVTMYGATASSYLRWDESEDRLNIFAGSFRIEQVPASNAGTAVSDDSDATINIDWSRGNYHWIVLAEANVTKIIFQNMKRGGRYILRIEQHASSAKTVAWTNVDSDESNTAFTEVRWVGGTAPTMSTGTGRVDVYGFLCTRSNGRGVDGFVIAQNLAEDGTH